MDANRGKCGWFSVVNQMEKETSEEQVAVREQKEAERSAAVRMLQGSD
jgi:hypothetical protein